MSFRPEQNDAAQGFFKSLPAWVLTFRDEEGFECIGKESTQAGLAASCYLSPLDAAIEAAQLTKAGRPHHVMAASAFDLGAFLDERGSELVVAVHVGWPAHNGVLLRHPDGRPGRCCKLLRQALGIPPTFEADAGTLAPYGRFREQAGLFAWTETLCEVRKWPATRLRHVATKAVAAITSRCEANHWKTATQLAAFDPEFGQWHFVPFSSGGEAL